MDFTREPILETIITPKEGCKLVVRSSKSTGQEEYFVDAVEIVAFGNALFFRSLERPKAFLVPVSDYEIVEVREARLVLKNIGIDRSIKIGGGREGLKHKDTDKKEPSTIEEMPKTSEVAGEPLPEGEEASDARLDKKRDRRRHHRKRRGRDEKDEEIKEPSLSSADSEGIPKIDLEDELAVPMTPTVFSSLLQPPPTLISETINRYRQNEIFKGAFYLSEEEQYKPHDKVHDLLTEDEEELTPSLKDPSFLTDSPSLVEENHEMSFEEKIAEEQSEEENFDDSEIPSPIKVEEAVSDSQNTPADESEVLLPLFEHEERVETDDETTP